MITFIAALLLLAAGYIVYGRIVEHIFRPDASRPTPAQRLADGVDYMVMSTWKVFLIQFLNIAGTGPIFGAIMGILFGPSAYLWIVGGCIFMGAVHDYFTGMISLRKDGATIPEIVGDEMGYAARILMRIFSLVLLILVGAVFVCTPADLLATLCGGEGAGVIFDHWRLIWICIIFAYYVLATLLPIDVLIGRLYPLFGAALLIMAVGVGVGIFVEEGWLPELTDAPFLTHHPGGKSIFPYLFITIACGALSGFHATQSPLMARCLTSEHRGRFVFYGAMITEGVVALIWAAAAIKFASTYGQPDGVILTGADAYANLQGMGTPAVIVSFICSTWMGRIGAVLAVIGVAAAPITSGDTALRSARLIFADFLHMPQDNIWRRLLLALPVFAGCLGLLFINFDSLWRYFGWTNQTLAALTLWTVSMWLLRRGRCYWVTFLPACIMTCVCTTYILTSPAEGFGISLCSSTLTGLALTLVLALLFLRAAHHWRRSGKIIED